MAGPWLLSDPGSDSRVKRGMLLWDNREPCVSCPYRKDVPLETWHVSEFENLMASDADPMTGGIFGCHKYRHRPVEERRPCVGWFLDQDRRGMPCIALRLAGMTGGPEAIAFRDEAHDGGHELYETLEEMCEANGAERARLKSEDDEGDWSE